MFPPTSEYYGNCKKNRIFRSFCFKLTKDSQIKTVFFVLQIFFKMSATSPKKVKKSAPKKPAEHPKYIDMVCAAITSLKERNGSSRQAIAKYIKANYKVGDNSDVHLKMCLKRAVASNHLKQTKGAGASGSFKVGDAAKAAAKPKKAAKKPAAKKPAAKKSYSSQKEVCCSQKEVDTKKENCR